MFEYNGYHFESVRKLKESEKKDICTFSKHIRSDRELGICDYDVDWKNMIIVGKIFIQQVMIVN